MPSSKDYVPSNDGRFLQWAKKLVTETASHAAAWEVSAEKLDPVQPLLAAYETAYAAYQDPNHGKLDLLNKNDTRDALKNALREFARAYLPYNPAPGSADRDLIG
jgi:hypothetical protein